MHNLFQGLILKFRGGGKLLLTSLRVYDNLDKNTVICHLEELNKKGVSGFIIKRRKDTVHQKEFKQTLYLIFDYPYKYYTFKLFEV